MKKILAALVLGLLPLCLCCGCGTAGEQQVQRVQRTDTAMGTVIQQTLYTKEEETEAAEEIMGLLWGLEEDVLSRRLDTSEVFRLNAAAGSAEGESLSASMEEILEGCLEIWRESDGAFDVTLGPVVKLWDIDSWAAGEGQGKFAPPEEDQLRKTLESCGSDRLEMRDGRLYMPDGMQLDLGAVGKGIALDSILAYLREKDEITGAVVSLGGSIVTYGKKPDGKGWNVGIADPSDTASNIGTLTLEGEWFISTSGDYERYVEADGIRYYHIIDPATGCPADSGAAGVTILADNGFLSDALSTACFILGEEKGMALAEKLGAEALFVGKDGSITMSRGMEKYFRPAE